MTTPNQETRKANRPNRSTVIQLVLWLQKNQAELAGKTFAQAHGLANKALNTDFATNTFKETAKEVGLPFKGRRRAAPVAYSDRIRNLAKAIQLILDDLEEQIGIEPGSLGATDGARETINKLVDGRPTNLPTKS